MWSIKHILTALAALMFTTASILAQTDDSLVVRVMEQKDLAAWNVPGANYSGITYIGDGRYAVVSDKEKQDGFYLADIITDSVTGDVVKTANWTFVHSDEESRDAEGIAYVPSTGTVFISAESDQRIIEYSLDGLRTGRELNVPKQMSADTIYGNYGFESLTYSSKDDVLWTMTENTLKADGKKCEPGDTTGCVLRLQSFNVRTLAPAAQYAYKTDAPTAPQQERQYAFGVSELCALDDGSLLVLEREFFVAKRYLGSYVNNKIYRVVPDKSHKVKFKTDLSKLSPDDFMSKELVCQFKTGLSLFDRSLANYEGMCLGPQLQDGHRALLLISDSQNNYGNHLFHLKDWIKAARYKGGI